MKEITSEYDKEELYYLKFTTSNQDSSPKKYGFGDISYTRKSEIDKSGKIKGIKDFGNFTLEKGADKNAFLNGLKVFQEIEDELIKRQLGLQYKELENEDREAIIDFLIQSYRQNNKKDIPKKLAKYSDKLNLIESEISKAFSIEPFLIFRKNFENELSRFSSLLRYAPFLEIFFERRENNLLMFLDDPDAIKKIYIETLFSKKSNQIKKLLNKEENIDAFSDETRHKLLQFADFSIFIHFDFTFKHWYQFESIFSLIKSKLNSEITDLTDFGRVPSKSIYRTLCSGDPKNDIQFPLFRIENRYKSFSFNDEDNFEDFLHTDRFATIAIRKLYGTDIGLYILPVVESKSQEFNISPIEYEEFFFKTKDETRFSNEPLFPFINQDVSSKIKRFDFIFSDESGNTIIDLIEISGLDKSYYFTRRKEIRKIEEKWKIELLKLNKSLPNPSIEKAFCLILGSVLENKSEQIEIKPNSKYKTHLLKVLPKIYLKNYYSDAILLSEFLNKIEDIIRKNEKCPLKHSLGTDKETGRESFILIGRGDNANSFKYQVIKLNLLFLFDIQNYKVMESISNSKSYQIGLKLGKLAKPLKKRINSFEKQYVGLLTRHLSTLQDSVRFTNDIYEKLARHGKTWGYMASSVCQELSLLNPKDFDRENIAFGFFEGYFKYEVIDKKKDFFVRLEKLLSDYEGNEELQLELERLNNLLIEITPENEDKN